jgi:predicted MFS family arabinose efflux permease
MALNIIALYRQAYRGLPRRAWILFAVNLVNSSGAMVIFFLSLYLTRKLGLGPARAGQALSLYGVGSLAGAFLGGWLADRVGSIKVQKASLAVCGVVLVILGQVRSVWGILPLLFGLALFAGMLYPANATSMSKICPPDLQVKGFALNRLANNLGATIGPAVGGVLALRDYRLLFWADGLTSLAAAGVFALLWRQSRGRGASATGATALAFKPVESSRTEFGAGREARQETSSTATTTGAGQSEFGVRSTSEVAQEAAGERKAADRIAGQGIAGITVERTASGQASEPAVVKARSPWRDGPFLLLMLIFFVWSAVFIQVLTTYPLYMRSIYGLAENRIGQLFAVNTILIVFLEMILMEKIRKYPLSRMINLSFILLGAGFGLMPLGRGFAFAALTVAIWTFGEMLSMPLVTALIAGRADDTTRGRYMGMFSFSFSLAFVVAPAAGMAVYERFGGDAVWIVCAALCLILAAAFSALRPALQEGVKPTFYSKR